MHSEQQNKTCLILKRQQFLNINFQHWYFCFVIIQLFFWIPVNSCGPFYKIFDPTWPAGRPDPRTSLFSRSTQTNSKRGKTISGTLVGYTSLPHVLHIFKILLLTSVIDYGQRRWRPRNIGKPVRRIALDSWKQHYDGRYCSAISELSSVRGTPTQTAPVGHKAFFCNPSTKTMWWLA